MLRNLLVVMLCFASSIRAGPDDKNLPEAAALLSEAVSALPDVPIRVRADLQVLNRLGDQLKSVPVEMRLDWRAETPSALYTIKDRFGTPLEQLAIAWPAGKEAVYTYFTGDPPAVADLPPLASPIQETDVSWIDLSLSFLWWENGKTVGAEDVKGRPCYIVDVPAPPSREDVDGVRLWIDPRIHIMLRAESFGRDGKLARRLDVKSFKKINGRWFVRDIQVERFPERRRTILRVRHVEDETGGTLGIADEALRVEADEDTITPVEITTP